MTLFITISVLLIITSTYFLNKEPVKIVYFTVIAYLIIPYFLLKFFPESSAYKYIIQTVTLYSFLFIIYEKRKLLFVIKNPIIIIFILTNIYLYFLAEFRNVAPSNYINYYRQNIITIIIFLFILINKPKDQERMWLRFLKFIVWIEVFLALLQYLLPSHISDVFMIERAYSYIDVNLVSGTFIRYNMLGNYLSLLLVYLAGNYYLNPLEKNNVIKNKWIFFIVLAVLTIFLTGARTSVISFFAGLLIIFWAKSRKLVLWILGVSILLIVSYINIEDELAIAKYFKKEYSNPIQRVRAFSLIIRDLEEAGQKKDIYYTGVGRTLYLFSKVPESPFFGQNILWNTEGSPIYSESIYMKNITDATLILNLIEFGIIGSILILYPFFYILFLIRKKCPKTDFQINLAMFIVLLLQTIQDQGLFYKEAAFIYFVTSGFQYIEGIRLHKYLKSDSKTQSLKERNP